MPNIPYFSLGRHSFEKNSGYKSTVHAIAELIDNSAEADATEITVVLMVDHRDSRLLKIAVGDNGQGMKPDILQCAICEKSGTHLDRQSGSCSTGRRKYGKYGVGLPKASISQCNKFTVWSWTKSGPKTAYRNGIDIEDEEWIKAGAKVSDCKKDAAPADWIKAAGLEKADTGTLVIWERLDGLTWARARWGENSGLIPNLEFNIGRTYRHLLGGQKPEIKVLIHVIDEGFRDVERTTAVGPNDPLYCMPGCKVPRLKLPDGTFWHIADPLFDDITGANNFLDVELQGKSGPRKVRVTWRRSAALKDTIAKLNNKHDAGDLPHGKHAARNVGLSLLREGREVDMSQALSNPSEPRERWFGVEFDFPHELDEILGMTNNKQNYTRLEQVLKNGFKDYQEDDETTQQCIERIRREDPLLSVCLEIAWKIHEVWYDTRRTHLNMRSEVVSKADLAGDDGKAQAKTPQEKAEAVASSADVKDGSAQKPKAGQDREAVIKAVIEDLVTKGNVPKVEAEQIAARIVDRGLTYAIVNRRGLGSPFFNIGAVVDAKLIELNEDHAVHPYLLSTIEDASLEGEDQLRERLSKARIAVFLMLEAWAKVEAEVRVKNPAEHRKIQRLREDWGRSLEQFVEQLKEVEKAPES